MTETSHVAPVWMRWLGVPMAATGALLALLTSDAADRRMVFLACATAAAVWIVAVLTGCLEVRRRDQEVRKGWTVTATVIITGLILLSSFTLLSDDAPFLVRIGLALAVTTLAMALASILLRLLARGRGSAS